MPQMTDQQMRDAYRSLSPDEKARAKEIKASGASPAVALRQVLMLRSGDPREQEMRPATTGEKASALWEGVKQGATSNFADEIAGAAAVLGKLQGMSQGVDPAFVEDHVGNAYQQGRDEYRANEEAARARAPGYGLAGDIGGGILQGVAPGLRAIGAGGGSIGQRALAGGGAGLAFSALGNAGAADELADVPGEVFSPGTLLGGALGAGGGALAGKLAARSAQKALEAPKAPRPSGGVLRKAREGVANLSDAVVGQADAHPVARAVAAPLSGGASEGVIGAAKLGQKLRPKVPPSTPDGIVGLMDDLGTQNVSPSGFELQTPARARGVPRGRGAPDLTQMLDDLKAQMALDDVKTSAGFKAPEPVSRTIALDDADALSSARAKAADGENWSVMADELRGGEFGNDAIARARNARMPSTNGRGVRMPPREARESLVPDDVELRDPLERARGAAELDALAEAPTRVRPGAVQPSSADLPATKQFERGEDLGILRRQSSMNGPGPWDDSFDAEHGARGMFDEFGNEMPNPEIRARWRRAGERLQAPIEGGPTESVRGMLDEDVATLKLRGRPTKGGLLGTSQYFPKRNQFLRQQAGDADAIPEVRETAADLLKNSRTAEEGAAAPMRAPEAPRPPSPLSPDEVAFMEAASSPDPDVYGRVLRAAHARGVTREHARHLAEISAWPEDVMRWGGLLDEAPAPAAPTAPDVLDRARKMVDSPEARARAERRVDDADELVPKRQAVASADEMGPSRAIREKKGAALPMPSRAASGASDDFDRAVNARRAKVEANRAKLPMRGGAVDDDAVRAVQLVTPDGKVAIISPGFPQDGKRWRISFLDANGEPSGHTVRDSIEKALDDLPSYGSFEIVEVAKKQPRALRRTSPTPAAPKAPDVLDRARKMVEFDEPSFVRKTADEMGLGGEPDKPLDWYDAEGFEPVTESRLLRERLAAKKLPRDRRAVYREILEENGIDDHDSAAADVAFSEWKERGRRGPKPTAKLGGMLDSFGHEKPPSSLLEAFTVELRGARSWADVERVLPRLAEALGVDSLRLPGRVYDAAPDGKLRRIKTAGAISKERAFDIDDRARRAALERHADEIVKDARARGLSVSEVWKEIKRQGLSDDVAFAAVNKPSNEIAPTTKRSAIRKKKEPKK